MQRLIDYNFRLVGEWRSFECRVHRAAWLRNRPGVYAFVVQDHVRYIGKADKLHRRLRNYSSRCFGPVTSRPLRYCHERIATCVSAGRTVRVYAFATDAADCGPLEMEDRLIGEFRPPWNLTNGNQR